LFCVAGIVDWVKDISVPISWEAMEGPVRAKQPVSDSGMQMGMKPGIIPEGVDLHDHAWALTRTDPFLLKRTDPRDAQYLSFFLSAI
jgi:hypothetical protein